MLTEEHKKLVEKVYTAHLVVVEAQSALAEAEDECRKAVAVDGPMSFQLQRYMQEYLRELRDGR
jgi:hypothetical protein